MDWRERERRFRRRTPFDDMFDFEEIDMEFERMRRYMDAVFSQVMSGEGDTGLEGKPLVYGFSMKVGPDGKPDIQEFGNIPGRQAKAMPEGPQIGYREPLVDVIDCEGSIMVTAELPGVEKKDIDLRLTKDSLTITVDHPEHGYHKVVHLPKEVDPESAKATCKNGILDIVLERTEPEVARGKRIDIE